jgi:hypothetical protein
MFPTIGFLVQQIVRIVGSQIKTRRIFSLASIFTNLRRCHLWKENLEKFIFDNKNWPNDARVGCESPSDLVEFIETYEQLKGERERFEGEFEWDEILIFFFNFLIFCK